MKIKIKNTNEDNKKMLKLSFKIILKWIKVYLTSLIQFLKISWDIIFIFSETSLATVSMIFSLIPTGSETFSLT